MHTQFVVQIKTDRGTFADYCGSVFAHHVFNSRSEANKAMARTQRATKGHHFQYRVFERNIRENKIPLH